MIYSKITYQNKNYIKKNNIDINNCIKVKAIDDYCFRCGNKEITDYCNNCDEFGVLKKDNYLYKEKGDIIFDKYVKVKRELLFTNLQKECSDFIKNNYENNNNVLIWAVCGAGKTEITFPAIEQIISQGKIVAFAITRIDILYDVEERIRWYFPNVKVAVLNSREKGNKDAQIYILTTNQLLKFKDAFSLLIVDEVDAFPYEYNEKFEYASNTSITNNGIIAYLTSTPSDIMLNKKLNTFVINRRWHGYDLPVPRFCYMDVNKLLKNRIPLIIIVLLLCRKRQQLWFVANIKTLKLIYKIVNKKYPKINFGYVYASDEKRRKKVLDFKTGKIDILLTTPILERGVTFDDIDVLVLDADSKLYNKAALVQIAGRVGRKKDYQNGYVFFFHNGVSDTMINAKKNIVKMNKMD